MAALNDLLKVNTQPGARLNANAAIAVAPAAAGAAGAGAAAGGAAGADGGAAAQSPLVSNFVTVQSLGTFAVAVPVMKTIWELMKALFGGWADSFWAPFGICLVYALWQFIISVSGPTGVKSPVERLSAAVIAVANAAILAAAVIGLTETTS
jgi:hypothetical protein